MFDEQRYAKIARKAVAEGCVLLKNDKNVLPLLKGSKIASFGRNQFNYFKSGTGSGGLVNTKYVVSILDALRACKEIHLNETVLSVYEKWIIDNPFDEGEGWALEPWCQKEMLLDEELVKQAAEESDVAIISIARLSGEDKDNSVTKGSYLLTDEEEKLLEIVCRNFDKTVVLLNVGNIIDMNWVNKYNPSAVMYVWQGGQEGGNGVMDLLVGRTSPSGKLTDTIPYDIQDNPSTINFGDADRNIYAEDIYVGYRYFETFAKDKVMYPFGYGLSYTSFKIKKNDFLFDENGVTVSVEVTNIGDFKGKEVIQLYAEAPQGKLGKASRVLCGFAKTKELNPGESEIISISCDKYYFASYDDSGLAGYKSAYVLEAGNYSFYVGNDVRCELVAGNTTLKDTELIEQLIPAMAPVVPFKRLHALETKDGLQAGYEEAPLRNYNLWERIKENRPAEIMFTGDRGYKLADVKNGKISMEEFVAQIPVEQLVTLLRGEGMCSPKVTPGTAAAFGGVTDIHNYYGIPTACCADGPSGIRMDVGTIAFSLPNGTCLACSFNESLSEDLFDMVGLELRKNRIESLLGPGMNLRRNPLNGRNFEYFSEDPFLTGKIGAAQLRGMHKHNVTGTIKHLACNNQEYRRAYVDAVVSERALREMYLKGFEIACKEGNAYSIMTSYNPINGLWAASNYDMLTQILRKEWKYSGIVMTDWWSRGNEEGQDASKHEVAAMVRSQNDLYMVVTNSEENSGKDNLLESVGTDKLAVGEIQRSAINVLNVVMNMPTMDRMLDQEEEYYQQLFNSNDVNQEYANSLKIKVEGAAEIPPEAIIAEGGKETTITLLLKENGSYKMTLSLRSKSYSELAQLPMSVFLDGRLNKMLSIKGTDVEWITEEFDFGHCNSQINILKFYFGKSGIEIKDCKIIKYK